MGLTGSIWEFLQDSHPLAILPKPNRQNLIENFFAKLEQYCGIAPRIDKVANTFLCAIYIVVSIIWLI